MNPLRSLHRRFDIRSLFIKTHETPNVNALKFEAIPQTPKLSSPSPIEFPSRTHKSLLASKLLRLEGVQSLMLAPDFISINKRDDISWSVLKLEAFAVLMEFAASNQPLVEPLVNTNDSSTDSAPEESEVTMMVRELLDTRIKPAVQQDGGDVELIDVNEETGVVSVKLIGSCRGCSSSSVTLKSGIEAMLKVEAMLWRFIFVALYSRDQVCCSSDR